jgi:GT2 family glycosyltransferase
MSGEAPVAVVVVSWNSTTYLPGCLDSLRALRRPPAELVVVDSGSTDGSASLVQRGYPEARCIACAQNVGFCRGNNLGIRATSSPFVLVLNPDTTLERDFLEQLLPAFEDARVGLVAGKLLRFDRRTIDSAGQELGRNRRPIDRGYGRPDVGQLDRDADVFGACGAAALYRRQMLEQIADPGPCYFDESFFAFGEDLDLAWRAQRRGWRAAYRYRAVGYHARGGTATHSPFWRRRVPLLGRSPELRLHAVKNRYLSILRNDRLADYLRDLPFILCRDLAVLGLLLMTSPGVLGGLWRSRELFREARRRGRLDAASFGTQLGEGGAD